MPILGPLFSTWKIDGEMNKRLGPLAYLSQVVTYQDSPEIQGRYRKMMDYHVDYNISCQVQKMPDILELERRGTYVNQRGVPFQRTTREWLCAIKAPGDKKNPLFQTVMGRANSDRVDVVYPDNVAYEAKAVRVLAAPAAYLYYTFKDKISSAEMTDTLHGFCAPARKDIMKCRWDGKQQRVITKRIQFYIQFDRKFMDETWIKSKTKENQMVSAALKRPPQDRMVQDALAFD